MNGIDQMCRKADFEAVYDSYYDRVYKYAYTLLLNKDDAEDVTADTFIAAYESFDRYDPSKASLSTYLSRIAHNRAVNLMRSAACKKRAELPDNYDRPDEKDDYEQLEASDTVLRLYKRLSAEERELLDLRYVMELKDREIAALLDLQEKAVNKRFQRLLFKCRMLLNNEG